MFLGTRVAPVLQVWAIDKVYPYGPRREWVSPDQVLATARHMRQHGFNAPLIVDSFGSLLEGTAQYLAAKRLGIEKVPVIVVGLEDKVLKVRALRKFTHDGETHEKDDVFATEDLTAAEMIALGVVVIEDDGEGEDASLDPKTRRAIERAEEEAEDDQDD